jgi:hypothetical protein
MANWLEQLEQQQIAALGKALRLPVEEDLARSEKRLKVRFPESYRSFCLEVGPGRFGDMLEIFVPWPVKGVFTPQNIRDRLSSFVDATGASQRAIGDKAIHIAYLVLGDPPVPRPISNQSGEVFFLPDEPTEGDEFAIYGLDRRKGHASPPRLVKLARSFTQLVLEGFAGRKLARLPFIAAPTPDQFVAEFRPDELPTAPPP